MPTECGALHRQIRAGDGYELRVPGLAEPILIGFYLRRGRLSVGFEAPTVVRIDRITDDDVVALPVAESRAQPRRDVHVPLRDRVLRIAHREPV